MFKKATILLLCLLYTVSVYGVAYNVNYCGSQIQSVNVGSAAINCPMCHGKAKMKCCKTNHIEVKVKDAHLINANTTPAKTFAFAAILPYQINFVHVWQQAHTERVLYHAQNAPPPGGRSIGIKNCTFLI